MRILIISPSLNIHGGVRVLVEWANGFARRGHDVTLQSLQGGFPKNGNSENRWIDINPDVELLTSGNVNFPLNAFDVAIAGSPHIAHLLYAMPLNAKKFLFLQMCEEIFQPDNKQYVKTCIDAYKLPMPLISISAWNIEKILNEYARNPECPIHYVGNGVSDDFKPGKKDDQLTILVEGWIGYNYAKDTDAIAPKVAKRLKEKYGARIIAYSQFPKNTRQFGNLPFLQYQDVPDEYYTCPDTKTIATLYQRSHLLVKASRYDARSCAPVEAMKCGTPTARAIIEGDDDLQNNGNALRCEYSEEALFETACKIIDNKDTMQGLIENGLQYAETYLNWDYWIEEIEKIFNEA